MGLLLTPINTAYALYVKSTCDKHSIYWLNLEWKSIRDKQSSSFIANPNSKSIQKCKHCELKFEESNDYDKHMIDDHNDWGL